MLDSALDCIVTIDHEGCITEFNPAAERVFGYRRDQVVGKQLADVIVPPSLRERHRRGFARYLATGEARMLGRRVEITAVRADGSEFPVELAITRIPIDGPPSFTGYLRDITKRKQSEEALRASAQVARGQVEALTFSLDVLATAPEPEKFIDKMLSTICRLLNAQSAILWLLDETNESLILRAWVEGANFEADPEHPFIKDPLSWKKDPGLKQMFFAGVPIACQDVEHDPHISSDVREYFLSHGTRKFLRIPILVGGHVRGFIAIRHKSRPPYRPGEVELAQALAHQVMLAIQLTELGGQSRQAAVLAERNRMARDIHDTLAQGFTAIVVQLQAAEDASARGLKKDAQKHLQNVRDLARQSLVEARRSVHALRPQALEDTSFWEALKGMIKQSVAGTELHTKFQMRGLLRELPPLWQQNLLHIGQEALTNTLKYAHAGRFEARLNFNKKELRLELEDDGEGFTMTDRHDGFGLIGMRERVEQVGGRLTVRSARNQGTKIVVVFPLDALTSL
jgi:PAS domain S-box-containing protein